MNFAQFLLVPVCVSMWGFSYLVMKHFTRSPGILHLKYYLILLRSSGYVTQPCVSWYPILYHCWILPDIKCLISAWEPHTDTQTHAENKEVTLYSLPILYGNTDATSVHPSFSSIVTSRHMLIQTSASTSRTTFRLLLKVRLQGGGKNSRKWPLESCGSITSSIRSLLRSNTILTVLLFLAIWFGGRVSCLLIKNSMDRSPASPVYLGQDTVPQCIHINCLSQDQGSDATKWTLAIKNVWLQFLLQRVSRPLIRFRGCGPGEPTI